MAWECAECLREKMTVVCHHCGKPLCDKHAVVVVDDALAGRDKVVTPGPRVVSDRARHCADCQKQHHPKAQGVRRSEAEWAAT